VASAVEAADSALGDRECENPFETRYRSGDEELCWRCENVEKSLAASAVLHAVREST
jgi:hypothetical protein